MISGMTSGSFSSGSIQGSVKVGIAGQSSNFTASKYPTLLKRRGNSLLLGIRRLGCPAAAFSIPVLLALSRVACTDFFALAGDDMADEGKALVAGEMRDAEES